MTKFWQEPMPDAQFERMKAIIGAPSPVGFEAAMTYGVLKPYYEKVALPDWKIHQFVGNAGVVLDTHPGRDDLFTIMVIGHADKIRMQVRSIGKDGKVWINSDSFLPQTLVGHEVKIFSLDSATKAGYRVIEGGTVEALSAIHLAPPEIRSGQKGIKKDMLYVELQVHGENGQEQVEALGIAPGDPVLLTRQIKRGVSPDTFYGAYLDNGLGCFVTTELATLVAEHGGFENIRLLFAAATHEEIGRYGSRILAGELRPNAVIAADVSHDYDAVPNPGNRRYTAAAMGKGFSICRGAVGSEMLNDFILRGSRDAGIPYQIVPSGRDFGTDGMAAALAAKDAAATSIGFPIRNMHTVSETGHTGDVLAAIAGLFEGFKLMDKEKVTLDTFKQGHPRLDKSHVIKSMDVS